MYKTTLQNHILDIEISSQQEISIQDPKMVSLVDILKKYIDAVPLKKITVSQEGSEYLYKIVHSDGRKWNQLINIINPGCDQSTMTFDVSDHWAVWEFAPNRALRDLIILMIDQFEVTDVKINFYPA